MGNQILVRVLCVCKESPAGASNPVHHAHRIPGCIYPCTHIPVSVFTNFAQPRLPGASSCARRMSRLEAQSSGLSWSYVRYAMQRPSWLRNRPLSLSKNSRSSASVGIRPPLRRARTLRGRSLPGTRIFFISPPAESNHRTGSEFARRSTRYLISSPVESSGGTTDRQAPRFRQSPSLARLRTTAE